MYQKIFYLLLVSLFLIIPLSAQDAPEKIKEDARTIYDYTQEKQDDDANTVFPYFEEDESKTSDYTQEDTSTTPDHTKKKLTDFKSPNTRSFDSKFSLRFSVSLNSCDIDQFYIAKPKYGEELELLESYESNIPLKLGLGFLYGNFALEFQKETSLLYDNNYIKTESQEFKLSYYSKKTAVEFHIKDFKGFHVPSPSYLDADGIYSKKDTDLEIQTIGISGQYVCNNKEYSWPAAFGIYEKQLGSASSFLLGGDALYITSERYLPVSFKREYITAIPKIGYGATFADVNNLFLSISFSLGAGIARELNDAKNCTALSNSFHAAAGYHWEDISLVISYQGFVVIIFTNDDFEYYLTRLTQCSVAKRF